jgi:RNA polymerase sigma-70 factor (ECF subfamily)
MRTAPAADPVPAAELPDLALADRVAHGDRDAFTVMMRRHNRTLYRAARGILGNDADAEDAVQDTWLDAHAAIGGFRGEAKLATWLTRIAVNVALQRLRKRKRSAAIFRMDGDLDMDSFADDGSATAIAPDRPDLAATRGETRRLLEKAVDALPEAFRIVFVLRAVEEMSVEEASAALGVPEATVRSRYFRARSQLRESLAREFDLALEQTFGFAGARCDRIVARVLARLDGASAAPQASPRGNPHEEP